MIDQKVLGKELQLGMIKKTLDLLFLPGEVFEVRIPGYRKSRVTASGYFNDHQKAAVAINKAAAYAQAVYVTANPVNPALLSRNDNQIEVGAMVTTTDADIPRRRWFLVDLDPVRPVGVSSSDEELQAAIAKQAEIRAWLDSLGWPEPLEAISGNGTHMMYALDLPNDDKSRTLVESATKMIAAVYSDNTVNVDSGVWNASRIWKLYGTKAQKGSDTPERPHRIAHITSCPAQFVPVMPELLETMGKGLSDMSVEFKDATGEYIADMGKWLADRGLAISSGPRPFAGNDGKKWTLSVCPFNEAHHDPMVGIINGKPVFRCLHNSCSQYRWREFREKVEPDYKDPDIILRRLEDWCNGTDDNCDQELLRTACSLGSKFGRMMGALKTKVNRNRFLQLQDMLKAERNRYLAENDNGVGEKYNVAGLISSVVVLQAAGEVPSFWTSELDGRTLVGDPLAARPERLEEIHEITLMCNFHARGDVWVKQLHARQAILRIAENRRINPFRYYFKQYRWDGVERIERWLTTYLGVEYNPYTAAVGKRWLISMIARGMEPGCQADHMLILEGPQGIGKSQALRVIGGDYYIEYSRAITGHNGMHKDFVASIIGKLVVEMSELAAMRKSDVESLKAMLTTPTDDARLAYGRDARSYPRTCVFAGSTNELDTRYINDLSGARRFWPVRCGKMNIPLLKQDRDQLIAEAAHLYDQGEDWYTVPEQEAKEEQEARQADLTEHPWFGPIYSALTIPDSYSNDVFVLRPAYDTAGQKIDGEYAIRLASISMLLSLVLHVPVERQTPANANVAFDILRVIGFEKRKLAGSTSTRWYGSRYYRELKRSGSPLLIHTWNRIIEAGQRGMPKEFNES